MSVRIGVALMAVLLALYIGLVGFRAVLFLQSGEPVGIAIGVALIVLPVIGLWALSRELWFGARAQALGRRLADEGGLPDDEVTTRPSGRPVRAEAAAVFPRYRTDVEERPDDWRAWYRLGVVYDAAGDRRRGREAIRTAIRLERESREPRTR